MLIVMPFLGVVMLYDGIVKIWMMRWYIPRVTPSPMNSNLLKEIILSSNTVDLTFMNKTIQQFIGIPGASNFPITLSYSAGVETPRYIVVAFQVIPAAVTNMQNFNSSIFNDPTQPTTNMININRIDLYIDGNAKHPNDYTNDFTKNNDARWYNEFKKFRQNYMGDHDETGCVSYEDFCNLYRIYVFDLTKQEEIIRNGISNVKLDFYLNTPIPQSAVATVNLYALSFYDRIWKLGSDGLRQYVIK